MEMGAMDQQQVVSVLERYDCGKVLADNLSHLA